MITENILFLILNLRLIFKYSFNFKYIDPEKDKLANTAYLQFRVRANIEPYQYSDNNEIFWVNFNLKDILKTPVRQLSLGQRMRCEIAASLLHSPKILFLDEPTLGLDVIARKELWLVIKNLKGKITIILTTHYMEEAAALSDRIGIMKNGKLLIVHNDVICVFKNGKSDSRCHGSSKKRLFFIRKENCEEQNRKRL